MTTNGKKFKLFIGNEEIDVSDACITPTIKDLESAAVHQLESNGFKASHSWSCEIIDHTIPELEIYRAIMMDEVKTLTDNYNRAKRIKNK